MKRKMAANGIDKYQLDGQPPTSGPGFGFQVYEDTLDIPLKRKRPTIYFTNSMSDLFHEKMPEEFLARVLAVMEEAQRFNHVFITLTKRPGNAQRMLKKLHPQVLQNLWLGTSVECDCTPCSGRVRSLVKAPAGVHLLSVEPMLGPVGSLPLEGIDWVIGGGESGAHLSKSIAERPSPVGRPTNPAHEWWWEERGLAMPAEAARALGVLVPDGITWVANPAKVPWVRELRDRCAEHDIAFTWKQWGGAKHDIAGRLLDGGGASCDAAGDQDQECSLGHLMTGSTDPWPRPP
jgi:protein gp37